MEVFETFNTDETVDLGRRLAERLKPGDLIALVGELGSGKTVLTRGVAMGLGVADVRLVSSPTYVLVQEYPGDVPVYHVDLYRLADAAGELAELGLAEMLEEGVVLIEWADRAGDALPRPHWRVSILATGSESRRFTLERAT
ncbi:hypothetical protein LCGC14_1805910 [marine sediment metagenome]|uniref:tRNA threonylcarbamoyladenosine biosynthesis protein TsaE n=1 Tax=marine sediment metagenome TaxID=412755 RepID=A0A0F9GND3_9ZZZZ